MQSQRSVIDVLRSSARRVRTGRFIHTVSPACVLPRGVAWLALTLGIGLLPPVGQAQIVEWARSAGGTEEDQGRAIAVDAAGNSYVTGGYRGTATFGSFTLTGGFFFVAKYDSSGNVLWVRSNVGTSAAEGRAIAVDATGNSYVTGTFGRTATFGSSTVTSSGSFDVFVAKYDPSGNVLWARSGGGSAPAFEAGLGIAVDAAGNSYVTGRFNGTATFGSFTLTSAGGANIFVAKYDANGNALWAESFGGTSQLGNVGFGISVDAAGNSYVTGSFTGTATFGAFTLVSTGPQAQDIFVAKFDTSGTVLWAQSTGGTGGAIGRGIAVDDAGNSFVTGDFAGGVTFGTFPLGGINDIFVVKYDTDGDVLWAQSAGGSSQASGNGIAVDTAGNSYVTGSFNGTASFGPTTVTSAGNFDMFVAKYDTGGTLLWARSAGGTMSDQGSSIGVDAAGNSYATGGYVGTATFGPFTLSSAGIFDIFVAKFAAAPSSAIPTVNTWGVIIMTLLLLAGAKVYFNRRRPARA